MDKALYISMTAAKHNMWGQGVHANNLANASTTGFRSDFAQARSMPVYFGEGHPTRAYALTENPATDYSEGPMIQTGRELDFAIKGEGFFGVLAADGKVAYMRSMALNTGPNGELMTSSGLPVMGDGGPIVLPPSTKIEIGADGTITSRGANSLELSEVDRILLVKPDLQNLVKGTDGLFRMRDGAELDADEGVVLQSGFLEGSNVNPMSEFTEVLTLSRQYELSVKLMKTIEGNSEATARLLQSS